MRKKHIYPTVLTLFVTVFLLTGCKKPTAVVKQEGPEEVAKAAVQSKLIGDTGRYMTLLNFPEETKCVAWKMRDFQKQIVAQVKKARRQAKKLGGFQSVELAEETSYQHLTADKGSYARYEPTTQANAVDGDTAEVTVKVNYGNGSSNNPQKLQLIKRKGEWLVSPEN